MDKRLDREMCYFCFCMEHPTRIIGRYDGNETGPLFICIGAIHGNEPAGVKAIETVLTLLYREPSVNPGFVFRGRMLGLTGNLRALKEGKRFIGQDMNRLLSHDHIIRIFGTPRQNLQEEDLEIQELLSTIVSEIAIYKPERIVVLDIHSASAKGGIFVISSDDPESIRIGTELHAPVILDFAREVPGTTLEYFTAKNFVEDIVAVVFECGQHYESLSVNRAVAAIINCMRTIGCINAEDVENKYDLLLQEYSKGLPKIARLIERYAILNGRSFAMTREFKNFDQISAGEIVAFSDDEPVAAKNTGLILLPRLQELGEDGYFIIEPIAY